jgi:tetratricopeptide (TPR) repeat protein
MPTPSSSLRSVFAFLAAVLLAVSAPAQQQTRDYTFTDATSEALQKISTALKNSPPAYDTALSLIDGQIAKVPADSYDAAKLYVVKVQTLFQKGEFSKAVEPLEKALAISEAKTPNYLEERETRELLNYLTQLYVQEAVAVQSKDHAAATRLFQKADGTMQKWLKLNPKSTADAQLLYAQLLYTWAVMNPEKPDLKLLQRSLEQADIGLKLAIRPKDTFYVIKLAALQQLGRTAETAEMFELLIKQKPETSTYYQQLAATYLSTGQELRAALTIERAQAQGHLKTPQYYFNLVGIYFNLAQYEKAADLLESGLKSGALENELKNWELLALCYQQLQRPLKGIDALKQASKAFPKSGQIEFMIAQAYHGLDRTDDAYAHLQAAVAKGGLTKPHQAYMYLAYIAFELKKFDAALDAARKAEATPEGAKDPQVKNMIKAIEDTIKDREAKKAKM